MMMSGKSLLLTGGVLAVVAVAVAGFSGKTSNCGGNSAALSNVREIALVAYMGIEDAPDHSFCYAATNAEWRDELARTSRARWLPKARFLVSTNLVTEREIKEHRLIAVCDTPYRNVPQKWIGSAPPSHAAGYSDGSCGLISTDEFSALDLSVFKPLDELYPLDSR
jgi:hypothetical protein